MFDSILKLMMRQRLLVILGGLLLLGAGVVAWQRLPIDAYPDVTNVQVMILTDTPGLTPVEVECTTTKNGGRRFNSAPPVSKLALSCGD